MDTHEYDILLIPQPEGGYVVSVPELPSVATEGETIEEALDMAKDAIEGYLATMREEGWELPAARHERVVVSV
jgi:antitoxin HicB